MDDNRDIKLSNIFFKDKQERTVFTLWPKHEGCSKQCRPISGSTMFATNLDLLDISKDSKTGGHKF